MTRFQKGLILSAIFLAALLAGGAILACSNAGLPAIDIASPGASANPVATTPPAPTPVLAPTPPTSTPPQTVPAVTTPAGPVVLNAPGNLTAAKVNDYEVSLKWKDNTTGEAGFHIETDITPAFANSLIFTVNAGVASYSDRNVAPTGDTYYYRVTAFAADAKESASSNVASVTISAPTVGKPNAPTGLAVSAASPGQIDLRWADNSADETGFLVERATDRELTLNLVSAMVATNATTYSDASVVARETYYYRILAINAVSPPNLPVASWSWYRGNTVAPAAPGNLAASAIAPNEVHLSWTNATTNQSGFIIDRATDAGFSANLARITLDSPQPEHATFFNDTSAASGTQYYYRVIAVNAIGASAPSNVATATTP